VPKPRLPAAAGPVVTHSLAEQRDLDTLADELGLTKRNRLWCEYIATGQALSNADAARLAGFPENRARQEGWRLSQRKDVRTYLQACMVATMQSMTVLAVNVLGKLLADEQVEARTRAHIAFGLLDRQAQGLKDRGVNTGSVVQVQINLEGKPTGSVIEH
jgi:phage terminase small subunit